MKDLRVYLRLTWEWPKIDLRDTMTDGRCDSLSSRRSQKCHVNKCPTCSDIWSRFERRDGQFDSQEPSQNWKHVDFFAWPSLKYFMVPNWVYVNAPPVKRHSIEPTELWLLYNILTSLMTVALCRTHLNLRPTCSDLPGPHSGECSRDNKWIMTYRELYSKVLWSFGHILTHCVMSPTLSQHRSGCTL